MDIFREPTDSEKKDWKPLVTDSSPSPTEKFRKLVEVKQAEYLKNRKPFCARCAKYDFQDIIDRQVQEMERLEGYADFSKVKIEFPELEQYGKPERFELVKETDAMEPVPTVGQGTIIRQMKIGIHRDFRCKHRKCGISIFISNEELDKEKSNKKEGK